MNGDVTVREVMRREFVGVSEGDTLRDTADLMLAEDVEAVVALRGRSPEGLLTQQDVLEATVAGVDLSTATVDDAMETDPATVAPEVSLAAATDEMSGSSTRHLLVTDGEEAAGLLSEHDVMTATTLDRSLEGAASHDVAGETVHGAESAGDGGAVSAEYSSQGICEVCGTLTRDLSTFNGQLVCSDCKDV
ncbi:MAG: cyclic nucleotide-binding/CBS domain-containing protein [Halorientalis sp.]